VSTSVNFIPPRRRQLRRVRSRARAWGIGVGALLLLLGGAQSMLLMHGDAPDGGVAGEVARVREALEQETRARVELERSIAGAEGQIALVHAIGTHPDWSVLLKVLANERGERVVLERVGLRPTDRGDRPSGTPAARSESYTINLAGQALTPGDASRYTSSLESLGLFDAVRLLETKLVNSDGHERVAFRIECSLGARPVGARAGADSIVKGGGP